MYKRQVLTIATNSWEEPTYFDIIVTRNVVEGAVTEKNEADEYVVINGEEYEITQGFRSLRRPDLEDEGKFYLDAEGRIAYYDVSSVSNGNFAYLYRTGTGTFEGENYIRMFTKDSQDVSYRIADKVRINKVYKNSLDTQYTCCLLSTSRTSPTRLKSGFTALATRKRRTLLSQKSAVQSAIWRVCRF